MKISALSILDLFGYFFLFIFSVLLNGWESPYWAMANWKM